MENRNEFGDLIVNRELTIKEFYELACKEGFENRFFSIKMRDNLGKPIGTSTKIISMGKWWTKDSAIVEVDKWYEPQTYNAVKNG